MIASRRELIIAGVATVASLVAIGSAWTWDRPAWLSDLYAIAASQEKDVEFQAVRNRNIKALVEIEVREQGTPPTMTQQKLMDDLDIAYEKHGEDLLKMREMKKK